MECMCNGDLMDHIYICSEVNSKITSNTHTHTKSSVS